ncbi:enkurin isoform X1 [Oryzias melastigma]|uniref:enkurin isoform X1 n=1 Tax=Oryzias melastigma TaxID=30732 RepID=UPI000CF7FFCB|nr:enkurin isoform X1 [Oryzias melastigma]
MDPPKSFYNLIQKEEEQIQRQPRYVSRFRPTVVLENKQAKDVMRTMGPANVEVPSPDKFLKKHSKDPQMPEHSEGSKGVRRACALTQRRPPVPARTDPPPMGQTKRGFIKPAATVPVKPTPVSVDSKKGHKQLLETSGLVPKYVMKKDYGEIPAYLQRRSEAEGLAQEEHARLQKEQDGQEAMQQLTEEERQAALQDSLHVSLLQGLKRKWDALHKEYQCLPLIIETLSQRAFKKSLEDAMKQLDENILLLERFPTIYVTKS